MKDYKFLDRVGVAYLWKRMTQYVNSIIPKKLSQLENDRGYTSNGVTSVNGSNGDVTINVPTKVSQLQNDSHFITEDDIPTSTDVYTKNEVNSLLNGKQNTISDLSTIRDKANNAVPNTRKVNNKSLSSDITLSASDVGALPADTTLPTGIPVGGTTGQVLKKTSNSDYAVEWDDEGSGASAFIAEYGVTSYADIKDAYDEDAIIICTVDDSDNTVVLQLAYFDDANDTFCFTQPVSEGSYWASISIGDTWDDGYFQFASTETATQLRDGLMSSADYDKLSGIEAGAEVNVQSDWNQTTTTAKDYIKNKPTIPSEVTEQTVSGWGFTKNAGTITGITMNSTQLSDTNGVVDLGTVVTDITSKQDAITSSNKLSADLIEDGTTNKVINVKPDWNAASGSDAEILNKPTIHEVPAGGNSGQVLKKSSATDYDYAWANQTQDYPSAYCKTAAGTAGKTAACTLWTATANTYLHLVIVYTNTSASALTLNINSTGAKPIYINGSASSSSNYTLPAGSYIVFYDGTNYQFRTDGKIAGLNGSVLALSSDVPSITFRQW